MSNTDSTPKCYDNPFIGHLPADTADNLIYGLSLLKTMRPDSCDHDEAMGLFRLLEALHGAAHHLSMQLYKERDHTQCEDKEAKQNLEDVADDDYATLGAMVKRRKVLSGPMPVEFDLDDDEFSALSAMAKEKGEGVNYFASKLISDHLKRWLDAPATA